MLSDIRYAFRAMVRRPFLTSAVVLTLGLGIGANVAVFRAFNAAFLRPLPFADADRLMRVVLASPDRSSRLSPRTDVFIALRDHNPVFSSLAGQRYNDFTLTSGGDPRQIAGIQVSEGWARTLGITAQLGRTFTADEDRQGDGARVALISDAMWRSQFAAAPSILGRTLSLDGRPYSIVGVLRPGVRFPYEADVWIPARFDQQGESTWALNIVGRLRDGISVETAEQQLQALSGRLEAVRAHDGMALYPMTLRKTLIEDEAPIVIAVTFASTFLLLLVAVNVANLVTVQSLSRQREQAVRSALGATLGRQIRQSLIEGLLLAIAGGAAGLVIALGATSLLSVLVPENFSYVFGSVPTDVRVLGYLAAIVLVTGALFGILPLLHAAREPQQFLIGAVRTTAGPRSKWQAAVATALQIALALILIAAAHTVLRDVQQRLRRDLGYDERGLLVARVTLPAERYPDAASRDRFFDALTQAVGTTPRVDAAGTVNLYPVPGGGALIARLEGEGVTYRSDSPLVAHNRFVHGRLMEAMRLRLIAGRFMTADELQRGDAVAVISKNVAQSLWPGQDAVGKRIRNRRLDDVPWMRVVGVIDEIEEAYPDTPRSIWSPLKLSSASATTAQAAIVARSSLAPEAVVAAIQASVSRIDPALALYDVATGTEIYRNSLRGRESARTLTGAFGILGMIVASIGIYASMAFTTSRRTREIAVRLALGATPRRIATHFLRQSAVVVAIGIAAGAVGTLALARVARSITSEFPLRVDTVVIAAAILGVVALSASWLPLRRAVRLDPSAALQSE